MKKLALLAIIASAAGIMPHSAWADRIILKSGEMLEVYNVEVGPSSVYYTTTPDGDESLRVKKSDVFAVKIGDGEMQTLTEASATPAAPAAAQPAAPAHNGPQEIKKAPAENNVALKSAYSANQYYIKDIAKKKAKNAPKSAILTFRFTDGSVLSNEDVEFTFEPGVYVDHETWTPLMQIKRMSNCLIPSVEFRISVTNKTDKVLYMDLANCTRSSDVRGYRAFYDGTQTYETQGSSSGAGVNLGAVAGALGIGGAVGTLASGIGIGGSSSSSTTTVKGQQRILVLPPNSTVILPPEMAPGQYNKDKSFPYYERLSERNEIARFADKFEGHEEYEMLTYTEEDTPARVNYLFTYSDRQDFATYVQPRISLYAAEATLGPAIWNQWNGNTWSHLGKIMNLDSKALIGHVKLRE